MGVALGTDVGVALGTGAGVGVGTGAGVGVGTGAGVGVGTGVGVGMGVGTGVGVRVAVAVGSGVGVAVGVAVGSGVGVGLSLHALSVRAMASTAKTASQRAQMGDTAITAIPLHLGFALPEAKPTAASQSGSQVCPRAKHSCCGACQSAVYLIGDAFAVVERHPAAVSSDAVSYGLPVWLLVWAGLLRFSEDARRQA